VGQPRPAETGPQLELLLKRLPVLLIRRVFYGNGVVTLTDFTALLALALALLGNIHKLKRGSWVRDKLRQIILHQTVWVSFDFYNAMSTQRHKFGYRTCLADESRSTWGLGRVRMVAYL
jgi:hypothetical protein